MVDYVTWTGTSGTKYQTELYKIGTSFTTNPGIYIFCKPGSTQGKWAQIYVGETENFNRRLFENLDSHHRIDCINKNGATHVCVRRIDDDDARMTAETDLRVGLDPECNRQ